MSDPQSFRTIRSWDGSQHRAFEELCYQVRDPTPANATLVKTGDPDGGLEWYLRLPDGTVEGWQAKYSENVNSLLSGMERSLKSAINRHPKLARMTFCISRDLPDAATPGQSKSARQRFDDKVKKWRRDIPGANRVEIGLLQGGELLERLAKPEKRGVQWFFWKEHVFDPAWCAEHLQITARAAGPRYTPELNVELPVAFAFEGLGRTDDYWRRYRKLRGEVARRAEKVVGALTGADELKEIEDAFVGATDEWTRKVPSAFSVDTPFPIADLRRQTKELREAASALYEIARNAEHNETERRKAVKEGDPLASNPYATLRYDTGRIFSALERFADFLATSASGAAETHGLLLEGEAGQGKTHLLCDVAAKAIERGQPAVVLLGQTFTGRDPWRSVTEQFGLGDLGWEELVAAMTAAGDASNSPFLLFIDALNESGEPAAWASNLRPFRAAANSPWVGMAVSYRSSYESIVLPDEGLDGLFAHVVHTGFTGREFEALQRFFSHFDIEQPRVPFLVPEFANPLFLKLYCQGLADAGLRAPPHGSAHLSDVFDRYLEGRISKVNSRLSLDPTEQIPSRALTEFAERLGKRGSDLLPRPEAKDLFESFAPHLKDWPSTLLGAFLDEGVLAAEAVWEQSGDDYQQIEGVRFSYQRFSDNQVVGAVLDRHLAAASENARVVAGSEELQSWIKAASPNWMRALSVQMPEKAGIELLDAADWTLDEFDLRSWRRALLDSLVVRDRSAVSERSIELAREAAEADTYLDGRLVDVLFDVAPDPDHPLNANRMHQLLWGQTMPDRDAGWGRYLYYSLFDRTSGVGRLLRWAAGGPYAGYPDDVLELATVPLVWLLGSPNRQLRDFASKALVQLLHPTLQIIERLGTRFLGINDPYILERLAVVAHGAVLRGGVGQKDQAGKVLEVIKKAVLSDGVIPNFLTRDAVRGIGEWCLQAGVISGAAYDELKPPYSSSRPGNPPRVETLEEKYQFRDYEQRPGKPYRGAGYGTIYSSVFGMLGDFGTYVITPKVRHFTRFPLSEPFPKPEPVKPPKPDPELLKKFDEGLTDEQRALFGKDTMGGFLDELSMEQRLELGQALRPSRPEKLISFPSELAQRWIFRRVLSLGWDPELFGEFDEQVGRMEIGREEHKPERFGKKYQWIALRELIARLADNFHMCDDISKTQETYEGPWQFFGRDLDPTLPPAPFAEDQDSTEESTTFGSTFPADDPDAWWVLPGPPMHRNDEVSDEWIFQTDDLPKFRDLVRRIDPDGIAWISLRAYQTWDDDVPEDQDRYGQRRRHAWAHVYAWMVDASDSEPLVRFLARRTLMGRWMPENGDVTDAAYLGEMPWAEAAREWPREWQTVTARMESAEGPRVLSAELNYLWEGNVLDASIDESVSVLHPVDQLFEAGGLSWIDGTTSWKAADEQVAQYVSTSDAANRHSALLVREDWLNTVLSENGWHLVAGWLGERGFIGGFQAGRPEGWLETTAIASLRDGTWRFGKVRHKEHRQ